MDENLNKVFEESEKKLGTKLLKINTAVKEALALTDLNIKEKSMVAPSIHHGFINTLFAERRVLSALEKLKEQKEQEYLEKYGKKDVPKFKTQMEIAKMEEMMKIDDRICEQKEIIRYLEEVCKIMSNYGFAIKNTVDLLKLEGSN